MFLKRSKTLGVIVPPIETLLMGRHEPDFGMAGMMQGAAAAASSVGYQVVINPATNNFLTSKDYLRLHRSGAVDGFVIWGTSMRDSYVVELHKEHVPFVLVQSKTAELDEKDYSYVGADDILGSQQCTEYLIKLGHRKIGYIRGKQDSSVGIERWVGFQNAIEAYGLSKEVAFVDGDYTCESGKKGAEELLKKNSSITAIVGANDLMAAGVISFLTEKGISIPNDMSVAGGDAVSYFWGEAITSFGMQAYEMATEAVSNLIQWLDRGPNAASGTFKKVFHPQIRIGKSTAEPRKGLISML
jgi:LacI family transcriptional regulator